MVGGATNKIPTICGDNPGQHSKEIILELNMMFNQFERLLSYYIASVLDGASCTHFPAVALQFRTIPCSSFVEHQDFHDPLWHQLFG